jgi:hypothetical protein
MKLALSLVLYYLGDIASRTIMKIGIGYGLYKTLMLWSVDMDKKFNIWKEAKPNRRNKE